MRYDYERDVLIRPGCGQWGVEVEGLAHALPGSSVFAERNRASPDDGSRFLGLWVSVPAYILGTDGSVQVFDVKATADVRRHPGEPGVWWSMVEGLFDEAAPVVWPS